MKLWRAFCPIFGAAHGLCFRDWKLNSASFEIHLGGGEAGGSIVCRKCKMAFGFCSRKKEKRLISKGSVTELTTRKRGCLYKNRTKPVFVILLAKELLSMASLRYCTCDFFFLAFSPFLPPLQVVNDVRPESPLEVHGHINDYSLTLGIKDF